MLYRSAALIVFLVTGVGAQGQQPERERIEDRVRGFVVEADAEESKNLAAVTRVCLQLVRHEAGPFVEGQTNPLRVRTGSSAEETPPGEILLTRDMSLAEAMHAIVLGALVHGHGLPRIAAGRKQGTGMDWVAAGICHSVLYCPSIAGTRLPPDYAPVRDALASGSPPRLAMLVNHPVPPQNSVLFPLYSLHCRALLDVLTAEGKGRRSALRRILRLVAGRRPPADALAGVLAELGAAGRTAAEVFRDSAQRVCRVSRTRASSRELVDRLARIETLNVALANAEGGVDRRNLTLLQAVEVVEDDAVLDRLAARFERRLNDVLRDAVWPLDECLIEYGKAVNRLRRGDRDAFRREMRAVENRLREILEQEQAVGARLDRASLAWLAPEDLHPYRLEAARRERERETRMAPGIAELLDAWEGKAASVMLTNSSESPPAHDPK